MDVFVEGLFCVAVEDLERNDGSPRMPYFMSKNQMRTVGRKNKKVKAGPS